MRYAWYVCPKCKEWKLHDENKVRLPDNMEEIQEKRYWRRICDDCKTEIKWRKGEIPRIFTNWINRMCDIDMGDND